MLFSSRSVEQKIHFVNIVKSKGWAYDVQHKTICTGIKSKKCTTKITVSQICMSYKVSNDAKNSNNHNFKKTDAYLHPVEIDVVFIFKYFFSFTNQKILIFKGYKNSVDLN